MKAIILAAGEGSRLRPYTNDRPKCMVELSGKTLLEWQISTLRNCGVDDIVVVTGFMEEKFTRPDIKKYNNPRFDETNMIYSLFCAEPELESDIIISYSDIIYEHRIVQALLNSEHDISIIIDEDWENLWRLRFDDPLDDAETLRLDTNGRIVEIGQKPTYIDQIEAQYIGLMRFKGAGLVRLKEFYHESRRLYEMGENPWNLTRPFEKAFMTDLFQALIRKGHELHGVPVSNGWLEVDTRGDYEQYLDLFADGEIKQYFNPDNS